MLPLSFSEFTDFCGVEFASGRPIGIALGGEPVLFDEMLTRYPEYGGMPAIASLKTTQAQHSAYVSGVYEAIAVRDIINHERGKGESAVTDSSFCCDMWPNSWRTTSATSVLRTVLPVR